MNKFISDLNRERSLLRMVPDFFSRKVLYVGASKLRRDFLDRLPNVKIVEIFKENVDFLRQNGTWQVYHNDICDFDLGPDETGCDTVMFWHGPEHLTDEQLLPTLKKLEKYDLVILGCPYGIYEQGEVYGNPYERHVAHRDYEFFNKLGYLTETLGPKDTEGSHILSIKYNDRVLPWLTRGANNYILNYITGKKYATNTKPKVLEFGCGKSTDFLRKYCDLTSIEHDPEFAEKHHHPRMLVRKRPYNNIDFMGEFDIIIVDGRDRCECVESSIQNVMRGGLLVLDNSERTNYSKATELLDSVSNTRIDFKDGWTTSIWSR